MSQLQTLLRTVYVNVWTDSLIRNTEGDDYLELIGKTVSSVVLLRVFSMRYLVFSQVNADEGGAMMRRVQRFCCESSTSV